MCFLRQSPSNVLAAVSMVFWPLLFFAVSRLERFRKQVDWDFWNDVYYSVLLLFCVSEAERFGKVLCYYEEASSTSSNVTDMSSQVIQCAETGCELLWWQDFEALPPTCQLCKPHLDVVDVILPVVLIVAILTALVIALSQNKQASNSLFWTYKSIHVANAIVWYTVGYVIKLWRCDCQWGWAVGVTTSFFGPTSAMLLVVTVVAEQQLQDGDEGDRTPEQPGRRAFSLPSELFQRSRSRRKKSKRRVADGDEGSADLNDSFKTAIRGNGRDDDNVYPRIVCDLEPSETFDLEPAKGSY